MDDYRYRERPIEPNGERASGYASKQTAQGREDGNHATKDYGIAEDFFLAVIFWAAEPTLDGYQVSETPPKGVADHSYADEPDERVGRVGVHKNPF